MHKSLAGAFRVGTTLHQEEQDAGAAPVPA